MPGKDFDDWTLSVFWSFLRTFVQDGDIEIGERDASEIVAQGWELAEATPAEGATHAEGQTEWRQVSDFRHVLIEQAKRNETDGMPEMAVMFYALWIEHTVNACLISGMQRGGYNQDVSGPLIRELRLKTKLTALWHIAGYEPLAHADILTVEQIAEARNAFVHYKWAGHDPSTRTSLSNKLDDVLKRAHNLEDAFDVAVDKRFWCGRKTEIMETFRELASRKLHRPTGKRATTPSMTE